MGNLPWQVRTWHELTCVVLIEYEEAEITDSLGPYIEADLWAIGEMDRKLDWSFFLGVPHVQGAMRAFTSVARADS